jgi:hypothetical protein
MSRETIEVGAFTWVRIQRLYDADPLVHWERCEAQGLECPLEAFAQLFVDEAANPDFEVIIRGIDWGRVSWELQEFSGVALRQVRVDRGFQYAVDEARERTAQFGITDDREEVVNHWREAKSWVVAPVIVAGDLLDGGTGFQLVVGFTRLGNMLALLDREEIPEVQKHLVWIGR